MKNHRKFLSLLSVIGLLIVIGAGCVDTGPGTSPTTTDGGNTTTPNTTTTTPGTGNTTSTATVSVEIRNFNYQPGTTTIDRGTRITWTNRDSVAHTVTADNESFDSGLLDTGETYSRTFDRSGTTTYHCTPHPNMKGTIIVR